MSLFTLALMAVPPLSEGQSYAQPASYESGLARFAGDMVDKHGFDPQDVRALLARATYRQSIIDAMERPYEAKPWHQYRRLFLTPERISGGVAFWRDNATVLERAEAIYGVPPEIIVAIVGVETSYGARLGDHRALDALTTLGFSYPKRADFFRGELEQLLLLNREGQVDAAAVVGSYAGALGKPQFIPSSYRTYAVDFDGDGKRDLWGSDADVIGSVAHYLSRHGWQPGEPVAVRASVSGTLPQDLEVADKRPVAPSISVDRLRSAGVECSEPVEGEVPTTLVRFEAPGDEYWIAFQNFYVITRYNHSNLYAMAAYQLSQAVKERYRGGA
ncbi:MAG: lytic murein transglycosylase B [Bdellovibrio bacteriovorus]